MSDVHPATGDPATPTARDRRDTATGERLPRPASDRRTPATTTAATGDRRDPQGGEHPPRPANERRAPATATPAPADRATSVDRAPAPTGDPSPPHIPDHPFRTVAIVGLGLIGGSLARALAALNRPPRVIASSDSASDLELAARAGVIEAGFTDPEAVLADADLVVYATPLDVTLRLLADHRGRWPAGAVVTDVAGLKAPVEGAMAALGESARYAGAHPMAGGEGAGFGHSAADLFAGATVWLTGRGAGAVAVEALWRSVGARTRWTGAAEHDRLMSWCSHLPQLTSNALARVLEQSGHAPSDLGTGGTDMVRLAGSSPEMWLPLLERSGAGDALRDLARTAGEFADALDRRDLEAIESWMKSTRSWRAGASKPPPSASPASPDVPGSADSPSMRGRPPPAAPASPATRTSEPKQQPESPARPPARAPGESTGIGP